MPIMKRISAETGEELPSSPEEEAEAVEALKGIFNGSKTLVMTDAAREDLKRMGITEDEILAMLAKDLGVQN